MPLLQPIDRSRHAHGSVLRALAVWPLALASAPVFAQYSQPHPANEGGQWAGPYDLDDGLTEGGQYGFNAPSLTYLTGEIVHAAVLPPAGAGVAKSRVLLVCDDQGGAYCIPGVAPNTQQFGRSYLWSPRTPGNVTKIPVPGSYPQDGGQSLFCGGHTFLEDGDLLWVGGSDFVVGVQRASSATSMPGAWTRAKQCRPGRRHRAGAT